MTTQAPITILWFRQDLRLHDNPALIAAAETGLPILPLYILDDENAGRWKMGQASRWWLHHSLKSLDAELNSKLVIKKGPAQDVIQALAQSHNIKAIYWNRCYEPWRITRDGAIKKTLQAQDSIDVKSFKSSLLFEPHETLKDDGTPYKVFTPFYKRGCLERNPNPRTPHPKPKKFDLFSDAAAISDGLQSLKLIPSIKWYDGMAAEWQPGEAGAKKRLETFLESGIRGYKTGRNHPAQANVSRLSAHLHFGEISPNTVWHAAQSAMIANACQNDGATFLSEIGWREFSHNLLYHAPDLPSKNWNKKFDAFPWRDDPENLKKWQKGQTGYPIIDAGMHELWQTGYMHNRVRMIVGSFLIKNLMLHWHYGEAWFWDTLVDANLANNSASWQWIAGCGADAAPYFRIFNPVTQGQKFDEDGDYVRRYVPELKNLPTKYLQCPWEAPDLVLRQAGITLGQDYPQPIVDLKTTRERALDAFKSL